MGQTSAWQRCPPSPIRRLAEITLCQNAHMLRISHWKRGEVCNSSRRSSCLRSSNRSVRHQKSTDQMRKSTAGFTAEHQIFELWFATSIQGANFSVNDRSCGRQCSRDLLSKVCECSEWMPVAREQLSTAMLDHGECSEPVHFQFVNPRRIIEGIGPLQERHWLDLRMHVTFRIAKIGRNQFADEMMRFSIFSAAS